MEKVEMNDFKKELFFKSIEIRNSAIKNIDDQVLQIKELCLGLITVLIGFCLTSKNYHLLFFSSIIVLFFWMIEAIVKKNQRGYIVTFNKLQKELNSDKVINEPEEFVRIIDKYYFDLNGFYTCRKSADKEIKKQYKKDTSTFRVLFLNNVGLFYLILFFVILIFGFLSMTNHI